MSEETNKLPEVAEKSSAAGSEVSAAVGLQITAKTELTGAELQEVLQDNPTVKEIADACRDVLNEDELEAIEAEETYDYALDAAYAYLAGHVDDPEAFLVEKGILQKGEPFDGIHRSDDPTKV